MMKRLLISSLAVLALQLAGCGGGVEADESQSPSTPVADDKTQLTPVGGGGNTYGTHVNYYSDATRTTLVGIRESGCSSATPLTNWGVVSSYSTTWKFVCAVAPQ
ncbi:hypothetical protein D7V97_05935 [Corallococcus sp. CA053C]|uniref:hypothetical protein n=1 Tax=Corallococcus sp. CA053C TaxID=2316732 RepID=UPI000E9FFCBB|nr:hypothetical protein [Corallococcus sp. CA053C]RKH13313.1 hypothetical protein D7V97_05935 [Corallococcus sp. CA053C]